ncbi:hypothetical protein [Nocardia sp. NPDC046763]|uniref:hypothetical protein n=1 Tax=Nocardia sp. NPDC046763 TaxID=3155256 RepID=UPI00340E63D3
MRGKLRPALMMVVLLTAAPLATGLATAQAAPLVSAHAVPAAGVTAARHHDGDQDQDGNGDQDGSGGGQGGFGDQNGPRDEGDWWFVHHCVQQHEWWQQRCRRDGPDMWHRGDPRPNGNW